MWLRLVLYWPSKRSLAGCRTQGPNDLRRKDGVLDDNYESLNTYRYPAWGMFGRCETIAVFQSGAIVLVISVLQPPRNKKVHTLLEGPRRT